MVRVSRLENGNVSVHVDCALKTGASRQCFVMPRATDGVSEGMEEVPFVQILGRAFKWKELLASGVYRGKSALARALGVDRLNLVSTIGLAYLSPVIVEKVVSGDLTKASLRRFRRVTSPFWYEQQREIGIG